MIIQIENLWKKFGRSSAPCASSSPFSSTFRPSFSITFPGTKFAGQVTSGSGFSLAPYSPPQWGGLFWI